MLRITGIVLSAVLAVAPLMAQRRGGGGGGGARGGGGGFSSRASTGFSSRGTTGSAYRGGVSGYRGGVSGYRGGSGYRSGLSGYRGGLGYRGGYGYRGYPRYGWGYGWYPGFYAGLGFGYYGSWDPYYYSYPGYYSGYGYGYGYGYAPPPVYSTAPSSPVVIVNGSQPYDDRTYSDPPESYADSRPANIPYQPTVYSIAFADHRIVNAVAYWVKDGVLHYVTREHEMKEVPLSAVDRRFSEQINRDKHVDFRLPES